MPDAISSTHHSTFGHRCRFLDNFHRYPSLRRVCGFTPRKDLRVQGRHGVTWRASAQREIICSAFSADGAQPAYYKYKSRKDLEKEYYRDWEKATLLAEEEVNRPMTPITFLKFLPMWFRFYAVPGPIRFVFYLISRSISQKVHYIHRWLTLEGAKLDSALLKRAGAEKKFPSTQLVLLRYHRKISLLTNIKYRIALLKKDLSYSPTATLKPDSDFTG